MMQPKSAGFYLIFKNLTNASRPLHLEKWDFKILSLIFPGKIFSKAIEPLKDEGNSHMKE